MIRNNIPSSRRGTVNKYEQKTDDFDRIEVKSSLRAVPFEPKGPKVRTFSEGRTCFECGVKLSIYNKGPNCYAHTEATPPRIRGRDYARPTELANKGAINARQAG